MKNNNALVTFNDTDFGFSVRTLTDENGTAWFVGKDIAENIGYSNTNDALIKHVDDEDKNTVAIRDGIRGNPYQTIINESGVYSLIFSSKLPQAKEFKHWVTSKVLPDIRKYGIYMSDKAIDELVKGSEQFQALLGNYVAEKTRNKALTEKLKEFSQYVAIGKAVSACTDSITFGEAACLLQQHGLYDGGRNTIMKDFRDRGLLCTQKSRWNKPSQKGIISGEVCLTLVDDDGNPLHYSRTKVTMDGLAKLAKEKFDDRF